MNIEKARELITHRLNDELTEEETRELNEYITAHPEFKEEIEMLEATWNSLDLLAGETAAPEMGDDLERALGTPASRRQSDRRSLREDASGTLAVPGKGWESTAFWAIAAMLLLGLIILFGLGGGPNAPVNPNIKEAGPGKPNQLATVPAKKADPDSARVLRVRGLLLVKGAEDNRWSLLQRGHLIAKDEAIRIPANSDFGA
ncbi:MAG: hypothetical protein QF473_40805, partial [Planctomycetota bacterium]|nr:hypothetical protein [Planctomycetota bacterium]